MNVHCIRAGIVASLLVPRMAHSQEIVLTGPLSGACAAVWRVQRLPSAVEATHYLSAAAVADGSKAGAAQLGMGAELTPASTTFGPGYTSGRYELRVGAWGAGATSFPAAMLEGGLSAFLGQVNHGGRVGLRIGTGFGDAVAGDRAHGTVTALVGLHQFIQRFSKTGCGVPPATPRIFEFGSVLRLFATGRRGLKGSDRPQWTFGLELSPTFFLPPYGRGKWYGGGPYRQRVAPRERR